MTHPSGLATLKTGGTFAIPTTSAAVGKRDVAAPTVIPITQALGEANKLPRSAIAYHRLWVECSCIAPFFVTICSRAAIPEVPSWSGSFDAKAECAHLVGAKVHWYERGLDWNKHPVVSRPSEGESRTSGIDELFLVITYNVALSELPIASAPFGLFSIRAIVDTHPSNIPAPGACVPMDLLGYRGEVVPQAPIDIPATLPAAKSTAPKKKKKKAIAAPAPVTKRRFRAPVQVSGTVTRAAPAQVHYSVMPSLR